MEIKNLCNISISNISIIMRMTLDKWIKFCKVPLIIASDMLMLKFISMDLHNYQFNWHLDDLFIVIRFQWKLTNDYCLYFFFPIHRNLLVLFWMTQTSLELGRIWKITHVNGICLDCHRICIVYNWIWVIPTKHAHAYQAWRFLIMHSHTQQIKLLLLSNIFAKANVHKNFVRFIL